MDDNFMDRWWRIPIKNRIGYVELDHTSGEHFLKGLATEGWEVSFTRSLAMRGNKAIRVIYADRPPYVYSGCEFGGLEANPAVTLTLKHFHFLLSRVKYSRGHYEA